MVGLIIGTIIIGLIVGAVARLVVPGRQALGVVATILIGIVGAVAGGFIARAVHVGTFLQFVVSVIVAAVLVALVAGSSSRTYARR